MQTVVIAEFGENLQQSWDTLTEASPIELSAYPKIYLAPPGEIPTDMPEELYVKQVSQVYNAALGFAELVVIFQPLMGTEDTLMPYAVLSAQDPSASTAARRYSRTAESWFLDNPGPHKVCCVAISTEQEDSESSAVATALISGYNPEMPAFQLSPTRSMDV